MTKRESPTVADELKGSQWHKKMKQKFRFIASPHHRNGSVSILALRIFTDLLTSIFFCP